MEETVKNQQRIIYIVGLGGSGTTLVSLLLSQMKDVLSLGEIEASVRAITQEQAHTDQCTCGQVMVDCSFWGPIMKQSKESGHQLSETQLHTLVLKHFQDQYPGLTMVDNSKYTDGLESRWLAPETAEQVDIRFIHAVRDYRGWAISTERTYATYKGYKGRKKALLLHCLTWWYRNKKRARQLKATGRPVLTLSYEALVFNLDRELKKICEFTGLHSQPQQADAPIALAHDCHGNPIRKDSNLYAKMKYDNRWTYDTRFLWLSLPLIPVHRYWKSLNPQPTTAPPKTGTNDA